MSFYSLLKCFLVLFSLIILSNSEEPQKKQKELSPARLRAEGDAAFRDRNYKSALKYYSKLIKAQPDRHSNFHKRALTYLIKDSYWKAVRDWTKALKLDSEFIPGYLYRGKTYKKLGQCSKALTDFHKVYDLAPNTKDIGTLIEEAQVCINGYEIALNHAKNKDCDQAIPLLLEILEIAPFDHKLNEAISHCYYDKGDYQPTLKYTGNILRVNAQDLDILLLRARSYYQMGEKDLALKHLKSGLKSDPGHKALKKEFKKIKKITKIINKANQFQEDKKWINALQNLNFVLTIDEENNHLLKNVYMDRCKCATRIRNQKAKEINEEMFEMNDEIRMQLCHEGVDHNQESGEAYFYRGKAFSAAKKWDEAVANFKNAASKDRGNRQFQEELRNAEFEKKKANRKDYYKILNIAQSASPKEVKKGFRKCGLAHHPDQVPLNATPEEKAKHEELFKQCVEAHDILTDPEVRARYDRGEDVLEQQQGGGRRGGFPFGNGFPFGSGGGGGGRTFTFKFGRG